MPAVHIGPPILTINEGTTYLVSFRDGSIDEQEQLGFFARDTRFLSTWRLTINQRPPELISSGNLTHFSTRVVLGNRPVRTAEGRIGRHRLALSIERTVGAGIHEDIDLVNHGRTPISFFLELTVGSDFADIFDVRSRALLTRGQLETRWDARTCELLSTYEREDFRRGFSFRLSDVSETVQYANGQVVVPVSLDPQASWHACSLWTPIFDGEARRPRACYAGTTKPADVISQRQGTWRADVGVLRSSDASLVATYERAIEDLGALRMFSTDGDEMATFVAAGVPWYSALFGRDSLLAVLQSMSVAPSLATGTLKELARWQATEVDAQRDAEPGKILHELRTGELAHFGEIPHTPYYGTVDATPLFPIALHEAWHWLGDDTLVEDLLDHARRAMDWLDGFGDGFVHYQSRAELGLRNQGWKDSAVAVIHLDGTLVEPPIALCEVQGYVYDAKLRMAELEDHFGEPARAEALRGQAEALRERFDDQFWMEEEGTYAFAIDGAGDLVRSVVSNPGHCLWSGIVPAERTGRVVDRLLADDMWSGWGIRTLSAAHPAFSAHSYQKGSVWPHDNSIIAAGFARYGFRDEANKVISGVFDAAAYFEDQASRALRWFRSHGARIPCSLPAIERTSGVVGGMRVPHGPDAVGDESRRRRASLRGSTIATRDGEAHSQRRSRWAEPLDCDRRRGPNDRCDRVTSTSCRGREPGHRFPRGTRRRPAVASG